MTHYSIHDRTYPDPIALIAGTLGGKWKLRLLWHLGGGALRYSEIRRALPDITPKMLTQQLRALEADGLVRRDAFAEIPPRVEYTLTEAGAGLLPAFEGLIAWASTYVCTEADAPDAPAPPPIPKTTITVQAGPGQFYARPRSSSG